MIMKNRLAPRLAGLMIGAVGLIAGTAFAEDVLLNAKIQDVVQAMDKNRRPYVRVIINEEKTLQGVSYEVGVPVMAFGSQVEKAKALKKGDILKAICGKKDNDGKTSYTLLKIVP